MSTITSLKTWMNASTHDEKKLLAERAGTSVAYLYHLAAGEEKGYKREPKPALAGAIERETKAMNRASRGRLPIIYRTDLNSHCRGCDFARRCLGEEVVTGSHFPVVTGVTLDDGSEGGSPD